MPDAKNKFMFVCEACEHFRDARNRSTEKDFGGCGKADCGSPFRGDAFRHYKGPLKDHLHAYCFMCGTDADAAVEVQGKYVGICNYHIPHLKTQVERKGGVVKEKFWRGEDKVIHARQSTGG